MRHRSKVLITLLLLLLQLLLQAMIPHERAGLQGEFFRRSWMALVLRGMPLLLLLLVHHGRSRLAPLRHVDVRAGSLLLILLLVKCMRLVGVKGLVHLHPIVRAAAVRRTKADSGGT